MAERRRHRPELIHLRVSGPAAAGLSGGEVSSRMRHGLANHAPDTTSRSLWEIVRANVLTLFNAIVGMSFVVLLLLGSWQDALFGLAAVGNAVIGCCTGVPRQAFPGATRGPRGPAGQGPA